MSTCCSLAELEVKWRAFVDAIEWLDEVDTFFFYIIPKLH